MIAIRGALAVTSLDTGFSCDARAALAAAG